MLLTNLFELLMPSHYQRHIKVIATLFFILFLQLITACGGKQETKQVTASEKNETESLTVDVSATDKAVAKLKSQKEIWLEKSITDYQIEMQKLCFCAPDAVRLKN